MMRNQSQGDEAAIDILRSSKARWKSRSPQGSALKVKSYAVLIETNDVEAGIVKRTSLVRADKIYTLNKRIILKRFGRLTREKYLSVVDCIRRLIE
jgi:mRNA-degrading endonuclease toxin of MazEF toxin-antitoxin module